MGSVPVKLKLFNSYCSSLYTLHLWWNYKKMSVTKLQITFHNILKRNIGLSKYDSTSIGVRANIHLGGGQTEFCPNGFGGGG